MKHHPILTAMLHTLMEHHPIMLHILIVMLHTLMEASSHHVRSLYSHVTCTDHPIMLFFLPKD